MRVSRCQGVNSGWTHHTNIDKVRHSISIGEFVESGVRESGRAGWYASYAHNGSKKVRCVHSTQCTGEVGCGPEKAMCGSCAKLLNNSSKTRTDAAHGLRAAMVRAVKRKVRPKVTDGHGKAMSKGAVKRRKRQLTHKIKSQAREILKLQNRNHGEVLTELALQQNFKAVASRLEYLDEQGALISTSTNNRIALAVAMNIVKNMGMKGTSRANRHNEKTRALAGILRAYCGGTAV